MKKISYILLATCMLFGTACEEWLDVNTNIDAPDYVDDYLYLAGVQSIYEDILFDLRYIAPLAQMWSSPGNGDYPVHWAPLNNTLDVGQTLWRTVYFNHGMNLDNMMRQAKEQEHWTLVGMAYVMKAHGWDMLTKIYGEAPLKQFLDPNRTEFDYDYQEEIYESVREWALEGIKYLEMGDNTNYGTKLTANDFIYQGNPDKWKKFAYAILVRNLASLTNKSDFTSKYADKLIEYAGKSFESSADDAMVKITGSTTISAYNNPWGTYRGNLGLSYFQSDYAVQLMTGTVPKLDPNKDRTKILPDDDAPQAEKDRAKYYGYELEPIQIICDTIIATPGHYDPRAAAKLATADNPTFTGIDDVNIVKRYQFYGGASVTGRTNPINLVLTPHFYGRTGDVVGITGSLPTDGMGRYLFHNQAPYVLSTYAEMQFCVAETYWKKGDKTNAYKAFVEGIKADMDFTQGQLRPGAAVAASTAAQGGDKINAAAFRTLANEYIAGPYVEGLGEANLTLSHIMMQKWCALWSWGGIEAWVDLRKYHYDLAYTGDYPTASNGGWGVDRKVDHKAENDPNRVFKGFYLPAARNVEFRNLTFNTLNQGPMYRFRPRHNSEYAWNVEKLKLIKPIPGTADYYHCSIPWFAYPNDLPNE